MYNINLKIKLLKKKIKILNIFYFIISYCYNIMDKNSPIYGILLKLFT